MNTYLDLNRLHDDLASLLGVTHSLVLAAFLRESAESRDPEAPQKRDLLILAGKLDEFDGDLRPALRGEAAARRLR